MTPNKKIYDTYYSKNGDLEEQQLLLKNIKRLKKNKKILEIVLIVLFLSFYFFANF